MKRYIILIVLLLFLNNLIFGAENLKPKDTYRTGDYSYDISGGVGSAINFLIINSLLPMLYFEFIFKFDYIFSKEINEHYRLGIGLSIGDSVNFSFFIQYFFINRIQQKITFVNMIGSNYAKRHALFEVGATFSFTSFNGVTYKRYDETLANIYYLTFFVAPYLFIGRYHISHTKNEITNIIGGFMELNIDIGKYISPGQSAMESIYAYFSIGVEYRIGHHIKKFK